MMSAGRINVNHRGGGVESATAFSPLATVQNERRVGGYGMPRQLPTMGPWSPSEGSFLLSSSRRRHEVASRTAAQPQTFFRDIHHPVEMRQRGPRMGTWRDPPFQSLSISPQAFEPNPQSSLQQQQHRRPVHRAGQMDSNRNGNTHLALQMGGSMLMLGPNEMVSMVDGFVGEFTDRLIAEANAVMSTHMAGISAIAVARADNEGASNVSNVVVSMRASFPHQARRTLPVERGTHRNMLRVYRNNNDTEFNVFTGLVRYEQNTGGSTVTSRREAVANPGENEQWEIGDFSYERLLELDNAAVPIGLPERQLRSMKPVPYAGMRNKFGFMNGERSSGDSGEVCIVCFDKLTEGEMVINIACGHTFHHKCILPWLARNNCCPTCRHEVPRTR